MEVYLGFLVSLATAWWAVWKYFDQRKNELNDRRFNSFHRLIKELVQATDGALSLDRQMAVIFELRNFPAYKDLITRILKNFLEAIKNHDKSGILTNEINETLTYFATRPESKCKYKWYGICFFLLGLLIFGGYLISKKDSCVTCSQVVNGPDRISAFAKEFQGKYSKWPKNPAELQIFLKNNKVNFDFSPYEKLVFREIPKTTLIIHFDSYKKKGVYTGPFNVELTP